MQGANFGLQFLTVPYLVFVLGASEYGRIGIAQAVVSWISVIVDYGFNFTATREISTSRNNPQKVNAIFWEVISIKALFTFLAFIFLLSITTFYQPLKAERNLMLLGFAMVFGQAILPDWFFQGMEDMKYISLVSSIPKALAVIGILFIIHSPSQTESAMLIISGSYIVSGLAGLVFAISVFKIYWVRPNIFNLKAQIKNGFHVFSTSVQGQIITGSSILVIGLVTDKATTGVYTAIEKLIRGILVLSQPFLKSIYPMACQKFAESWPVGLAFLAKFLKKIECLVFLLSMIFMIFGSQIVSLIYGKGYYQYGYILLGLAPWIILNINTNFLGIQYLVASGNAGAYNRSFSLACLTSLILYLALAPVFQEKGVIAAVLGGETVLLALILFHIRILNRKFKALPPINPISHTNHEQSSN